MVDHGHLAGNLILQETKHTSCQFVLTDTPRRVPVRREKGNKAQALKLLKAVQGRLGGGSEVGGALLDIGGENDLVRVAPKVIQEWVVRQKQNRLKAEFPLFSPHIASVSRRHKERRHHLTRTQHFS